MDPAIPFDQGDTGDRPLIARLASQHRLDACMHCAAFAYVGESMHGPARYFENNVAQGRMPSVAVYGKRHGTADGTAVRDYIHVSDLSAAHLLALDYLRSADQPHHVNLGNGRGFSVLEVIETARRVTGQRIAVQAEEARPGDPPCLVADASKAGALLGWKPAIPELAAIIESAWAWQRSHPDGYR